MDNGSDSPVLPLYLNRCIKRFNTPSYLPAALAMSKEGGFFMQLPQTWPVFPPLSNGTPQRVHNGGITGLKPPRHFLHNSGEKTVLKISDVFPSVSGGFWPLENAVRGLRNSIPQAAHAEGNMAETKLSATHPGICLYFFTFQQQWPRQILNN